MNLDTITDDVKRAVDLTSKQATRALRKQARKKGWGTAADGITVDLETAEGITLSPEAEDKEYGSFNQSPLPVAREYQGDITAILTKNIRDQLRNSGVVI